MSPFKGRLGWITALVLLVAIGATVAWRVQSRSAVRDEQATRERLQRDVQDSISKSMSGVKMCPLSDPDCNTRR